MNGDWLRRVVGLGIILVSAAFVFLAWDAYLVLKRGDIDLVVISSILFGGGVIGGVLYLTVPRDERRMLVTPDLQRMSRTQCQAMAIVTFTFAIACLWLTQNQDEFILRGPIRKVVLLIGFSASLYVTIRYLLEAWRRPP